MIPSYMSPQISHIGVQIFTVRAKMFTIHNNAPRFLSTDQSASDLALLIDLFGNSEGTKLLIYTIIFVWSLLRQKNGGSNSGLKPATIVTDAYTL